MIDSKALEHAAQRSYEYEGDRKGCSYVGWDREPEEVKIEWRDSVGVAVAAYLSATSPAAEIAGTVGDGWQPRVGDPVEVTDEVLRKYGEWARVPLWVAGIQKDRGVDGLNVAVSEEWPVKGNSQGYTDGFYIGRADAPDDLKPRAMTSPSALSANGGK